MKSLLYHGFGIKGYRYCRTRYEIFGGFFLSYCMSMPCDKRLFCTDHSMTIQKSP